ncbi:23S rRNA (uridine(2552)-2'-O)-methyltransferase RlmE [Blochmannia endosymbiont of Camponotus (Colobopsis) obliquus]|uniref:23S rRNA (uridine(2552)-2'-O)-methyltransferase RlmE n=1 Tax=Blochmannia endosymbiont of Camponotus (Colobopsis) obliquus TaxID=1505597 RepID=UPI00061A8939|nr:23S rRNA (uridine(2552)-2'-O)-methyltransferase RlmE [Blochmannia endosymbiont of Camponotus (Colobopsis) obliquus]AKC60274.1 ribosomal RNA large subunit methyltransferase E [Blochmannia endosymbiont of Camponotus (Colobopsis) obliquus]
MVMRRRSVSSSRWLYNHYNDQYVQQVFQKQLRSRSWFKLASLQCSDNFLRPGIAVIDLGSSPGGWSQYIVNKVRNIRVVACDILPMHPIKGVNFLQGDISENKVLNFLFNLLNNKKVQVILSDMSPNISGKAEIDIPKSISLGELVVDICRNVLEINGVLVVKVFQGEGFDRYLCHIRTLFTEVKVRKPHASCVNSREVYIVAKGYKL